MTRTGIEPWFDEESEDEIYPENCDGLSLVSRRIAWNDGSTQGEVRMTLDVGPVQFQFDMNGGDAVRLGELLKKHGERAISFDSTDNAH